MSLVFPLQRILHVPDWRSSEEGHNFGLAGLTGTSSCIVEEINRSRHRPSWTGGVAARSRKCRVSDRTAQTGWLFQNNCLSNHPGASRHPSWPGGAIPRDDSPAFLTPRRSSELFRKYNETSRGQTRTTDMSKTPSVPSNSPRPLRLWPGIAAAVLIIVLGYLLRLVAPAGNDVFFIVEVISAMVGALVIVVWWIFFSRATWFVRLGAMVTMILAVVATRPLLDKSIAGGAMGGLGYVLTIPALCVALVIWAIASIHWSAAFRCATLVVAMLLASGTSTLLRTDGISSSGFDLRWRWTPTAEELLLAHDKDEPVPPPTAPASIPSVAAAAIKEPVSKPAPDLPAPPASKHPAEWPGFRGPLRDGIVRGVRIETDWSSSPPVKLWSRPIGPGWSSFAVDGDLLYTQEQRGEEELVACYRVSTGAAGVEASRPGPLLRIQCGRRSARNADAQQRPRLRIRRDRNPERARRYDWRCHLVARCGVR